MAPETNYTRNATSEARLMDLQQRVVSLETIGRRWRWIALAIVAVACAAGMAQVVKPLVVNTPIEVVDKNGKTVVSLAQNGDATFAGTGRFEGRGEFGGGLAFSLTAPGGVESELSQGKVFKTVTSGGPFQANQEFAVFEGFLRGGELLVVYKGHPNGNFTITDKLLISGRNHAFSGSKIEFIKRAHLDTGKEGELRFKDNDPAKCYRIEAVPVPKSDSTFSKIRVLTTITNSSGTHFTEAKGVFEPNGL